MNKTLGNFILWGLLFALVANGAIDIGKSMMIAGDKLGRIFVILVSDTDD